MILAGDVGGTKTLLGLFDFAPRRPVPVDIQRFPTAEFDGLPAIVSAFLASQTREPHLDTVCIGVAGPVVRQVARLTNVPWDASADELARTCRTTRVRLLNDLEAMAHAIPVLDPGELHTLQRGQDHADGNAALIAAGTGLGESVLHHVDGKLRPFATEGGHADFAARNSREIALLQMLLGSSARADIEQVVSGPGIVTLHRFTHGGERCDVVGSTIGHDDAPATISQAAIDGRCERCVEALDLFASAYGAAAGNLALRTMSTAGLYLGGGIAPKILPVLEKGGFLAAFNDKAPMEVLLQAMPVQVILNPQAALLGAAVHGNEMI